MAEVISGSASRFPAVCLEPRFSRLKDLHDFHLFVLVIAQIPYLSEKTDFALKRSLMGGAS